MRDLDKDLLPDAAFTVRGAAEVVLNILNTPAKIVLGRRLVAADLGIAPGDQTDTLITVAAVSKLYQWSATDLMTGSKKSIGSYSSTGTPIMGCYVDNSYTPTVLLKARTGATVKMYRNTSTTIVSLGATATSVKCGSPEKGNSSIFSLEGNATRKTVHVKRRQGTRVVLSSPPLSTRFDSISLFVLPRGESVAPTPMILARQGSKDVVQVLTVANRWQSLALPTLPSGSRYTDITGIRYQDASYVVLQITNDKKGTSYAKVKVPSSLL